MNPDPHPSSYRDPDARVFVQDGRVFRVFSPEGARTFSAFVDSGIAAKLAEGGRLVGHRALGPGEAPDLGPSALTLEHPRVPFLSYAYEWSFEMLRAAGLLELDLAIEAFDRGYVLKDATPYNVQFLGPRPVHIDVASFEPWKEGAPWQAYTQFGRLFLNPLLLTALTGTPFQPWLRGRLDGLAAEELSGLLPLRKKLRRGVFLNVLVQGWLNRKMAGASAELSQAVKEAKVTKEQIRSRLEGLRAALLRLRRGKSRSTWARYEQECSVGPEALAFKDAFVERALAAAAPAAVWDLGANTGRYSLMAARHAKQVVALERDPDVVDLLFQRAKEGGHANVLPLAMDLLDPSPGLGFEERERGGLLSRGRADFCLCLALVHHLAISGNLPLPRFFDWLARIADGGVMEFVPREDPKVQELLRWREDIFKDYTKARFEEELSRRFSVAEQAALPGTSRVLYRFARRTS